MVRPAAFLLLLLSLLPLAPLPLPAAPAGEGDPAAALAAGLRSDAPARRRAALEEAVLRAPASPAAEAARLRGLLARHLPVEKDPGARALAARALGVLGGEEAAPPLLEALALEPEPAPQEALVEALASLPAGAVSRPLSRLAFGDGDPGPRALAAAALGRLPGEGPLRALLALEGTTHPWPVEAAVVAGLGLRTSPEAADRVIASLRSGDPAVRIAAREAAEALLGEDLGPDPAAWEERWKARRAAGDARPPGEAAAAAAGPAVSAPAPPPGFRSVARFYDLPVEGARVAFVLDCSQSMWGPSMEEAKREITAAVKGLRRGQRFGVVLFHQAIWTWREDLVPATPAMKWAFVRTVEDLPTKSFTNIHDALERALGWAGQGRRAGEDPPGLDEVFLLSDGEPNRGRLRDPDAIAEAVRAWCAAGRVRLHTVAVGERPAEALLRRLAEENGGRFARR